MKQESKLQTKEDAIDLVKSVFQNMGGRVLPPRRPRHRDKYDIIDVAMDSFMMDFENSCLEHVWKKGQFPKGPKRHEDPEWAAMIQTQVYPHHSDVDWEEYTEWVSRGFGDEWFSLPKSGEEPSDDEEHVTHLDCVICKGKFKSVRLYEEPAKIRGTCKWTTTRPSH